MSDKPSLVSEPALEFLFAGILHWVDMECQLDQRRNKKVVKDQNENDEDGDGNNERQSTEVDTKKMLSKSETALIDESSDLYSMLSVEERELERKEDIVMAAEYATTKV